MIEFWNNLGKHARVGLIAGVLAIAAATLAAMWLLRTEYQVLFSDLAPQDAGAMANELERMKLPYRIGDNGTSILIDKELVHQTRIKLMSKELPLHGTLGFELFNNVDFGMTEFAQKVNYQRALQGEITRTILSLAEIQAARVHLALPEEGLFKRAGNAPKASITLTMKKDRILRAEQVAGIQRLVSAAVPGVAQADVTIVDQHGVALTRAGQDDNEDSSSRLELKKEMEKYLSRKVSAVLDRTFGAGQAIATVDVSLNMDRIRTTIEDVIAPQVPEGQVQTGTLVREREVVREGSAAPDAKAAVSGGSSQREMEYSVGRRVENIVAAPGSIRRLDVVAVVRKPLDAGQQESVKSIIAAAVGASSERGDNVIVQPISALVSGDGATVDAAFDDGAASQGKHDTVTQAMTVGRPEAAAMPTGRNLISVAAMLTTVLALTGALLWSRRRARHDTCLSEQQKKALLEQLQGWMREAPGEAGATAPGSRP